MSADRLAEAKAAVAVGYHRLGFSVERIRADGDPVAEEQLARATERWHAAAALLAAASSEEECAVADREVEAGLDHVANACVSLGIDPPGGVRTCP